METVLLTAFEPFGDYEENPTETVLADIPDFLYNAKVIKVTLPVVYHHAFNVLLPYIEKHKPKVIVMLGLAGGRTHVSIERVAVNIASSKQADNLGNRLHEQRLEEGGADAYFTNMPLSKIIRRLHKKTIPAAISESAGTFVCNTLMYRVMHLIRRESLDTVAGFVHVPLLPHQTIGKSQLPSLEKRHMVDAVLTIIDTLINPVEIDVRQV